MFFAWKPLTDEISMFSFFWIIRSHIFFARFMLQLNVSSTIDIALCGPFATSGYFFIKYSISFTIFSALLPRHLYPVTVLKQNSQL